METEQLIQPVAASLNVEPSQVCLLSPYVARLSVLLALPYAV